MTDLSVFGDKEIAVEVTFTETITRSFTFHLAVEEDADLDLLDCSEIHESLDQQSGWDQLTQEDWLTGSIEERVVDGFEISGHDPVMA